MAATPKCASANAAPSRGAASPRSARPPTPADTAPLSHPDRVEPRNRPPPISPPASSSPPLSSGTRCHTSYSVLSPPPSPRNSISRMHVLKLFRDSQPPASLRETPCPQSLSRSPRRPVEIARRRVHPSAVPSSVLPTAQFQIPP